MRKHNPFISFTTISKNSSRCAKIVPSTKLSHDILEMKVPQYVFYTPNMNNDGHDTGVSYASKWLKGFLEPMLTNSYFAKTIFLITFDENNGSSGNHIYSLLIGGGVMANTKDSTKYTHYSQLKTLQTRWGLSNLGKNDVTANAFEF
jgi:hypothetical protein